MQIRHETYLYYIKTQVKMVNGIYTSETNVNVRTYRRGFVFVQRVLISGQFARWLRM